MDVADRSLQSAGFEYGSGAGVSRDPIDNVDRAFGGVGAGGTKKGAGLDKTVAANIGCGHEFFHGVNKESAGGPDGRFGTADHALDHFVITQQHRTAKTHLLAGKSDERIYRALRDSEGHDRHSPGKRRKAGQPVQKSRLRRLEVNKRVRVLDRHEDILTSKSQLPVARRPDTNQVSCTCTSDLLK